MEAPVKKTSAVAAALLTGLAISVLLARVEAPGLSAADRPDAQSPKARYRYRRVICMSPAVTEIVFAAGAGERVVGVSQHSKHPPRALRLPDCGGFYNPNMERILSLRPDLILAQGEGEGLERFARANRIELVTLGLTDLDSVFEALDRTGRLLEVEHRAELAASEMRYRLARVRARVAEGPRVPVLLVTGREEGALADLHVVGPGTFLHDVARVAGGRNVFADLSRRYGSVSKEAVLKRAPQVVVELRGEGGDPDRLQRAARRLWASMAPLPAVREGRIHLIAATYAVIPGPRVVELAERLAEILHGEEIQWRAP